MIHTNNNTLELMLLQIYVLLKTYIYLSLEFGFPRVHIRRRARLHVALSLTNGRNYQLDEGALLLYLSHSTVQGESYGTYNSLSARYSLSLTGN